MYVPTTGMNWLMMPTQRASGTENGTFSISKAIQWAIAESTANTPREKM